MKGGNIIISVIRIIIYDFIKIIKVIWLKYDLFGNDIRYFSLRFLYLLIIKRLQVMIIVLIGLEFE